MPETPGPGQESCWSYPRPPRLSPVRESIVITFAGVVVCRSETALRILETSHPPTYYLPVSRGFRARCVGLRRQRLRMEGRATYFDVVALDDTGRDVAVAENAAWGIPTRGPLPGPGRSRCGLPGGDGRGPGQRRTGSSAGWWLLRGWITDRVVGPFKGSAGSWGW